MKLLKGYSPKYSSGYLFYLVPEHIHFMHSQGIGYLKHGKDIIIKKVSLFRAADSLTPIGIPDEATQSNTWYT